MAFDARRDRGGADLRDLLAHIQLAQCLNHPLAEAARRRSDGQHGRHEQRAIACHLLAARLEQLAQRAPRQPQLDPAIQRNLGDVAVLQVHRNRGRVSRLTQAVFLVRANVDEIAELARIECPCAGADFGAAEEQSGGHWEYRVGEGPSRAAVAGEQSVPAARRGQASSLRTSALPCGPAGRRRPAGSLTAVAGSGRGERGPARRRAA